MNSCVKSGGTQTICACSLRGIENAYTLQEFSRIEVRATTTGKMPDDILKMVADCRISTR
jgi:hypothetical protein